MAIPQDTTLDNADTGEVTPAQLAAAWKKRGGFDSLRKQLLADYLRSPEKDKLMSDLDNLLPALLASTPSIARQDKKDRPSAVIRTMTQIETLKPQVKGVERRLRDEEDTAKRIRTELKRSLCDLKGVPFVEEDAVNSPSQKADTQSKDVAPIVSQEPQRPDEPSSSKGVTDPLSALGPSGGATMSDDSPAAVTSEGPAVAAVDNVKAEVPEVPVGAPLEGDAARASPTPASDAPAAGIMPSPGGVASVAGDADVEMTPAPDAAA
ncbi:hypothetical protein JCM8202_003786 [Rhodotorula sphaerocarpa]